MKFRPWVPVFAGWMAVSAPAGWAAVSEDTFQVRNTADLVELCSATQSDPLFTAAINFCHGFGVGTVRVLEEQEMANPSRRLFCLPNPMPTRNEGVARFVQWARANPNQMGQPATDAIAVFLSQQYPCPRGR